MQKLMNQFLYYFKVNQLVKRGLIPNIWKKTIDQIKCVHSLVLDCNLWKFAI